MRKPYSRTSVWWKGVGLAGLALVLSGQVAAQAQTAQVTAALGNFDVVNYTTYPAHGYEVEIESVNAAAVYATFAVERYGAPRIITTPTGGIIVRYESAYDAINKRWVETTVPHAPNTGFQGTCYSWYPATYPNSGCEHFGIALSSLNGKITHRWLVEDANAPGTLVAYLPAALVVTPVYTAAPPAAPGLPPVIVAEVEAPDAPDAPDQFGDAQWMKTFVRQLPVVVALDQLVADNPLVVPMDPAQLEANWQLVQADPPSGGNGNQNRTRTRNQGSLDPTTQSVVRRIELYNYTGAYDPTTHEALCADTLCNAPGAGELGDFVSAQMTAAIVQSDSITVGITGNGKVESADKRITCPNKCVAPYNQGTAVTLTAKANSGSTFAGWTGACIGTNATCTVAATGHVSVTATFALIPTTGGGGGGGGSTSGGGSGGGGGGTSGGGSGGGGKTP